MIQTLVILVIIIVFSILITVVIVIILELLIIELTNLLLNIALVRSSITFFIYLMFWFLISSIAIFLFT